MDSSVTLPHPEAEYRLRADYLRRTVIDNPFVPWTPNPKQAEFLTADCREMLYGGAAGGGKSVALLIAALQFAAMPGYAALLLRRTFADLNLPDALVPLSHQWLQGKASWDGQKHRWQFPNGSVLQFGYLETEIDKYRYQGAAFQFIGFDELTQFTESQYRYLFSRLRRRDDVNVPLRMRAASNPGGIGHDWVKRRFVDPARTAAREFVPARLEDNPKLDAEAYEESLNQLDPITRAQLRSGDWDVVASSVFKREWFRYWEPDDTGTFYLLGADHRPVRVDDCTRFAAMDVAGTEKQTGNDPDFSVLQIWDVTPACDMILVEQIRGRFETPDVADHAVNACRRFEPDCVLIEKNGIGLGVVQTVRRRGVPVRAVTAKRDKIARSQTAQIRMEAGTVYLPRQAPWLDEFEGELLAFSPEAAHDDQVDALSYAARHAQRAAGPPPREGDTSDSPVAAEIDDREQDTAERTTAYADDDRAWVEIG